MDKVKIKLISIGYLPSEFCPKKVEGWKSSTFEIIGKIDNYKLGGNSDKEGWVFSDRLIKNNFPDSAGEDFTVAIVYVPIENNWISRRLGNNQIVFTFRQVKDMLDRYDIPLENAIYRLLYANTIIYHRFGNKIPDDNNDSGTSHHDETRGCLFDMLGIKEDIIEFFHRPKICDECIEKLKEEGISASVIELTQKDIKRIKKGLYYRISDFVKNKPVRALILSSVFAVFLGVIGSVLGSYMYSCLTSVK